MTVRIIAEINGKQEKFYKDTRDSTEDWVFIRELTNPEPPLVELKNVNNRLVAVNKKSIIFAGGDE